MQRSASEMMNHATMRSVSGMLRNFSATLPDTLLAGLPGSLLPPVTPRPVSVPQTARAWQPGDQASFFKSGVATYACRRHCSRLTNAQLGLSLRSRVAVCLCWALQPY